MADEQVPETDTAPAEPQTEIVYEAAGGIKRRNPFLVFLFTLITLGIYGIYWLVSTTRELQRTTQSAPKPWWIWLMLIPVVNIVIAILYYWKYSKALNELTGFSAVGMFVLWLFISPVAMILAQIELNKMASA